MARRSSQPAKLEEVTDLEAEGMQTSGLNLEAGIVFTTFMALLAGLIVAQMCLDKYFQIGILN